MLPPALDAAIDVLAPGGRLVVISYHSGEDRIVKERFRRADDGGCTCPPGLPCGCGAVPEARLLKRGGWTAAADEIAANPRAASARLRAVEKLPDPPSRTSHDQPRPRPTPHPPPDRPARAGPAPVPPAGGPAARTRSGAVRRSAPSSAAAAPVPSSCVAVVVVFGVADGRRPCSTACWSAARSNLDRPRHRAPGGAGRAGPGEAGAGRPPVAGPHRRRGRASSGMVPAEQPDLGQPGRPAPSRSSPAAPTHHGRRTPTRPTTTDRPDDRRAGHGRPVSGRRPTTRRRRRRSDDFFGRPSEHHHDLASRRPATRAGAVAPGRPPAGPARRPPAPPAATARPVRRPARPRPPRVRPAAGPPGPAAAAAAAHRRRAARRAPSAASSPSPCVMVRAGGRHRRPAGQGPGRPARPLRGLRQLASATGSGSCPPAAAPSTTATARPSPCRSPSRWWSPTPPRSEHPIEVARTLGPILGVDAGRRSRRKLAQRHPLRGDRQGGLAGRPRRDQGEARRRRARRASASRTSTSAATPNDDLAVGVIGHALPRGPEGRGRLDRRHLGPRDRVRRHARRARPGKLYYEQDVCGEADRRRRPRARRGHARAPTST